MVGKRKTAADGKNVTTREKNATAEKGDAMEKRRDVTAREQRVTVGKKRAAVGESNAFTNVLFHYLEKMGVGRGTFSLFYLPLRANTGHSVLRKRKQGQTIPYILSKNRHKTA